MVYLSISGKNIIHQLVPMRIKNFIHDASFLQKIAVILLQSIVYGTCFYFMYRVFPNTVLTSIELVSVALIAWYWGNIAGLAVIIVNMGWTSLILWSVAPGSHMPILSFQSIAGILIHICFCIATGTIGALTSKLRIENKNRKEAQEQLKQYQNSLEELVLKRTQELQSANERLRQAEKMEAVGQLAGGIAHDFNNQLTIVLGYCELLSSCLEDNPLLLEYVQKINNSGKRASDLTKQLLAFARKGVYKQQVVNVHEIIRDVSSLLSCSLPKNIVIETSFESKKPFAWGGVTQLQNAILNLALNARDAMENGGTLSFHTKDVTLDDGFCRNNHINLPSGKYILLSVKDTGCGMSEEVKKHLFEPFFTTKEEGKGTGMGLAAVYGIVKSHMGCITVQSAESKGSKFTIYLPETEKPQQTEHLFKPSLKDYHGYTVLVIDDEKEVASTIAEMLGKYGFSTTSCYSGVEAIELYRTEWEKFNVVIIDMAMPDMDGKETYLKLREINPSINAIISSGFALNNDIELTLKAGCSAFLQKPYNQQELLEQIETMLLSIKSEDGVLEKA
jgi:signal transduction histidine kinase/ActR/RegA family two-component response regulator